MSYFVKTVAEGQNIRVQPLSGQKLPNGNKVDVTFRVSCSKEARVNNQVGTVFFVKDLLENSTKGFYTASPQELVPVTGSNAMDSNAIAAYDDFIANGGNINIPAMSATPTAPLPNGKTVKKSRIEKLLSTYPCPNIHDDGFYVDEKDWMYVIDNLTSGKPLMLAGPTGAGKTELFMLAAEKMDRPFFYVNMGGTQDAISSLIGVHRLDDKGHSIFDFADFVKGCQTPDAVVCLDEITRASPSANNIVFPTTDSRKEIDASMASSSVPRKIALAKNVAIVATANMGVEFTGTNELDRALLDRFEICELDYLPKNVEIELLVKRSKCSNTEATKVVDFALAVRRLHAEGKVSTSLSTRMTLGIAAKIVNGFPIRRAIEMIALPIYDKDERSTLTPILPA
jgi:MoxR-like ATPase